MNQLTLSNNDEDKKIITFTINKAVKEKLRHELINSKTYNLKKKSDWVNEAIEMLKSNPRYEDFVYNAERGHEAFVFDKILMSFKQRCFFADVRNEVVRSYPDIRGPQAAVIRAAILSRLTRNK